MTLLVLVSLGLDSSDSGDQEADRLFDDYFESHLQLNPTLASSIGDRRYDDRLELTLDPIYRGQIRRLASTTRARLAELDLTPLSPDRRISRAALIDRLDRQLELLAFPGHLLPIDSMDCFPDEFATLGRGLGVHRFETHADFENFLLRTEDFVRWVDLAIESMREGVRRGYVLPRIVAEETIRLVERQTVESAHDSVFAEPLHDLPTHLSRRQRRELRRRYLETIETDVLPAYRRLHAFLSQEYLPHTRDSVSWSELPDGADWYRALVRFWTSTELTPSEIHAIGRREVARIGSEIQQLRVSAPRSNPAPRFATAPKLIAAYRELDRQVRSRLTPLFGRLAAPPLEIEPTHLVSHYRPGAPDGSRPGRFMLWVDRIDEYPRSPSPALLIHEGVPGHHFQHAVQQRADLPRFRRYGFGSAYTEGWALYAESLGGQLGLYDRPEDQLERLYSELFRAIRLVVDTGLHPRGWSADEALDYFEEHLGYRPTSEVIRYIALPGQALSYKIGELKLLELRQRAEARLGAEFDIVAFHIVVLEAGSLPLDLIDLRVESWIERTSRRSRGSGNQVP